MSLSRLFLAGLQAFVAKQSPVFKQSYGSFEPGDCFVGKNALLATTYSSVPLVTETNTPQPMDAAGGCLLYYKVAILSHCMEDSIMSDEQELAASYSTPEPEIACSIRVAWIF
jgi:hypothetical protein